MADFSAADINEAKRRVREMQSRARAFVPDNQNTSSAEPPQKNSDAPQRSKPQNSSDSGGNGTPFGLPGLFESFGLGGSNTSGDSSLILALILILSREKADNMLILALLYILL